ncbi:adenylyltransferase/cytidyltransferase family protein [Deinococcus arcticus]|uniref:adenylyltransferase/cytidyltransferase family protein n=1 Tax=Deinococcus arcticus TaxID=2136176 RepID=UPI001E32FEFC|nr:adenylyltransferase/cytidyltransferase family protein [Deinococcus arcticus]
MYIGRFQPPHAAHLHTMRAALASHGQLLVLLGSANLARSHKNPWTAAERARLIRRALAAQGVPRRGLHLRPLPDEFDAARWAARVRAEVEGVARLTGAAEVVLTGFEKDASSAYLRWFPEWRLSPVPARGALNATALRAALFEGRALADWTPIPVAAFLQAFRAGPAFARLQAEFQAVQAEQAALRGSDPRHEVLRLFVDHAGAGGTARIWLGRRPGPIGAGLLALPGEMQSPGAATPSAAAVFDHPGRSLGWPAVAHVVPVTAPLPGTRPMLLDRALQRPHAFFEDHAVILRRLGLDAAPVPA